MAPQLIEPFTLGTILILTYFAHVVARRRFAMLFGAVSAPVAKTQFRLADVYVLLFQFALSACFASDSIAPAQWSNIAGLLILWALQGLWWYWGVRALSRRGIDDPLRRVVALGVVCPWVFAWPLASTGIGIGSFMFGPFLVILLLLPCLLVFALLNHVVHWIVNAPSVPKLRRLIWFPALIFLLISTPLATAPFWSGFTVPPIFYTSHVLRFRQEMRWRADIPAIQAWMKTVDLKTFGQTQEYRNPMELKPPKAVTDLSTYLYVTPEGSLVLTWGGGFGHWGLEVAEKGTPIGPFAAHKYALPLADGAWVWIDDH